MHRLAVLASLGLLLTPVVAGAEGPWGETRLPGTCLGLRKLVSTGAAGDRLDGGCLLDVVRAIHNTSDGTLVPRVGRYLSAMGALAVALQAWPEGIRLPDAATPRKDRDAVRDLCEHLGLRLRERSNTYTVELDDSSEARERVSWLEASGIRPHDLIDSLNARRATPVVLPELSVRLPLPDFWARELPEPDRLLAAQIVSDRRWALLYYGLMALDDQTLTFLGQQPALLRHLRSNRAGVFATLGRSIRVRNGQVAVPGGAPALAAWTSLVGETPETADVFIRALMDRDDGRLAYFYDLAAHLDSTRRAFVLGLDGDAGGASRRARDVYARFPETATWKIDERPFFRPLFDASFALSFVGVRADHTVGPEWWPSLFERIAGGSDWPSRPDEVMSALRDRPADAQWLLDWLFASPDEAPARFRWLRFAQRVLPDAPRSTAFTVESAIRTMRDLPALALSLERMGVTDPELITDLGRAARRLTDGGSDAIPSVARWQASLALVEQIQRRRRLPAAAISSLLRGLIAAVPDDRGQSAGAMAAWVAEVLVPGVLGAPVDRADLERSAVEAFAGNPASPGTRISWEGLEYAVGDAAPIVRQVLATRQLQRLPRLQHLAALNDIRRRLEKGLTSVDEVTAVAADLTTLQAAVATLPQVAGKPAPVVRDYVRAVSDLAKIKKPRDLSRVARALPAIGRTLDSFHDVIIAPLVYALAVAPSDQPLQTFTTAWARHSLVSASPADLRAWTAIAWQPARTDVRSGGGILVRGGYFALDVTLAEQRLPIVAPSGAVPRITGEDRQALVASISLTDTVGDANGEAASVLAAIAKGRAEIANWQTQPLAPERLRAALEAALVDEWRINLILAIAARNRTAAFATLRLTEIWRLGGGTELLGVFGVPATAFDGCLCRRREVSRPLEDLRSRVGTQAALVAPDLMMRFGEQLARQKLPGGLSGLLLPIGVATWLAAVHQVDPSDWESLALPQVRTDFDQVETALLHLVALGVLAAPGGGGSPHP